MDRTPQGTLTCVLTSEIHPASQCGGEDRPGSYATILPMARRRTVTCTYVGAYSTSVPTRGEAAQLGQLGQGGQAASVLPAGRRRRYRCCPRRPPAPPAAAAGPACCTRHRRRCLRPVRTAALAAAPAPPPRAAGRQRRRAAWAHQGLRRLPASRACCVPCRRGGRCARLRGSRRSAARQAPGTVARQAVRAAAAESWL